MAICWHCHWGWSPEVKAIYQRGIDAAGYLSMHYGPAHIVWEDENFETSHIQWCIDHASEYRNNLTDEQFKAVVDSLKELLTVPEPLRLEPEDYDDEHPENFPPVWLPTQPKEE